MFRAYIPSLAAHLPLIRKYRDSNNTVIPFEHQSGRGREGESAGEVEAFGEAVGGDLYVLLLPPLPPYFTEFNADKTNQQS